MKHLWVFGPVILLAAGIASFQRFNMSSVEAEAAAQVTSVLVGQTATVYKTPTCGCCTLYTEYLEDNGMKVDVTGVSYEELAVIRQNEGIPEHALSCHTAFVGDYFIEGHVPLETIEKLLQEQTDVDGITLPGMPAGSPGMAGARTTPFNIHSIKDGLLALFTTL